VRRWLNTFTFHHESPVDLFLDDLWTHLPDKDGGGVRAEARIPAKPSSRPPVWPPVERQAGLRAALRGLDMLLRATVKP